MKRRKADLVAEAIWRAGHCNNTRLPWPEFCSRPVHYEKLAEAAIGAMDDRA